MIDRSLLTANDFIGVRAALVAELDGDAASALVLTRIYFRADANYREAIERDGHWWWRAPLQTIAEETGLTYAAVCRAVTKLLDGGHIAAEKHRLDGSSDQCQSYRIRLLDSADDVLESADQEVLDSADLPITKTVEEVDTTREGDPRRPTAVALAFNQFYELYPRRVGRRNAQQAFAAAVKRLPRHLTPRVILDGADRYRRFCEATGQEQRFIPYPATWLNRDGWNDELTPPAAPPVQPAGRKLTAVERNLQEFQQIGYGDEPLPPLPSLAPAREAGWSVPPPHHAVVDMRPPAYGEARYNQLLIRCPECQAEWAWADDRSGEMARLQAMADEHNRIGR